MKKLLAAMIIVFIILSLFSCKKNSSPAGPAPTATPVLPYVLLAVTQNNGTTTIGLNLNVGNSSGAPLTATAVSINGSNILPEMGTGVYFNSFTGAYFTPGTTITFSASTSLGTVTGSGVVPEGDAITTPINGATIASTSPTQIDWTGPTSGIKAHVLIIYVSSPISPTYTNGYSASTLVSSVAAGTLPVGTYNMFMSSGKYFPLTNATPDSIFDFTNSLNTVSITIN